ncbi:MAG: aryl-sulfate sulfotransferase [Lachnospiraceae bacterium]|nr:aryl-sulfate sulfotransferase [Lachnospiraceae bacterium]
MGVDFREVVHVIDKQTEAENAFLAEYAAGTYTIEHPYVKLNPYLIAPLTALVMFETAAPAFAKVTVKGKAAAGDMMYRPVSCAKKMVLPVYGLYEDYDNTVVIELSTGERKEIKIRTEKAPDKLKKPTKIETTPEYLEDNVILVSPTSPAFTAAYDYAGDARWYNTLNLAFDVKRLRNGRLIMGTDRLVAPPYHTTGLYEMGMIGKIYKEYRIPGGYHHDEWEMENGDLLILTQELPRGTVEDMCVMVDRHTGEILKSWDHQDVLPVYPTGGSGSQDAHDWFHNNAVWYDKRTNSLTFSGRHQDAIINRDFETGKLNWIIGDPEGWPEDMQKYFFKPVGEPFDWQYEQHACMILPNGNVMCFDNGHYRSKVKENYIPAKDNFSRGVIYHIDTDNMTIEQVWQYGKERGAEFFSCYICNCEYYEPGHYMVHSGGIGKLDGEWLNFPGAALSDELESGRAELNSITVELKDDKVMYEMHLPANYYRAEKLHLYDAGDVLTFGAGERLGTLGHTEEFLTEAPAEPAGMIPDDYHAKIAREADRLVFKASFEKGTLVMLNLEGQKGTEDRRYFVPTTKRPFLAMCVGTFLEHDARAVEFPVSTEALNGTYKITVTIDDKKYDTGIQLTF